MFMQTLDKETVVNIKDYIFIHEKNIEED